MLQDWTDNRRRDGLLVAEALDGWVILPFDDRPALAACPCCQKRLPTRDIAQQVADRYYPPPASWRDLYPPEAPHG